MTADGVHRAVDTIVVATGFETTRYLSAIDVDRPRRAPAVATRGTTARRRTSASPTAGFPNLFMLYGPNTNNGSILFMIERQVAYTMRQLERIDDEGLAWIDVRPDVMSAYNDELRRDLDAVDVWQASCNNYYRGPSRPDRHPVAAQHGGVRGGAHRKPDYDAFETG